MVTTLKYLKLWILPDTGGRTRPEHDLHDARQQLHPHEVKVRWRVASTDRIKAPAKLLQQQRLAQNARLRQMAIDPGCAKVQIIAVPVVGPHVDGGIVNAVHGMVGRPILAGLQGPAVVITDRILPACIQSSAGMPAGQGVHERLPSRIMRPLGAVHFLAGCLFIHGLEHG